MKSPYPAAACAAVLMLSHAPAQACSTCECGDYTITLMGTEKSYAGRLRGNVDYLQRWEEHGPPGGHVHRIDEWRTLFGLGYSHSEDLVFALQLPWVRRDTGSHGTTEGLGDVELTARWTAWRSDDATGRHRAGARLGTRLPTSEEEVDARGRPVSDVQLDAGAWAPTAGGWYAYYRFPWFISATATYVAFGDGHAGFDPADVGLVSLLGQYAVSQSVALQLGVDGRYADVNRQNGADDPNSGGLLTMGFVGAALRLYEDVLVHAGVQVPLVEDPNGYQKEGSALRFGATYDF